MQLIREAFPDRPAFDMAVSSALLARVARGELPPTLRIHQHRPTVAFGKRDTFAAGYPDALRAVRSRGFEPIERLAGGRAAVYHEGTIEVGEVLPDADANLHLRDRFAHTAELLASAVRRLGVDARVGEVAGEYCPGEFSVNARGAVKLAGSAQRVIRGGAYVGTVVVVHDAARIAAIVREVYAALGLEVAAETTGAIEDEAPGVTVADVERVLLDAFGERGGLEPATLDEATLALAAEHEPRFRAR